MNPVRSSPVRSGPVQSTPVQSGIQSSSGPVWSGPVSGIQSGPVRYPRSGFGPVWSSIRSGPVLLARLCRLSLAGRASRADFYMKIDCLIQAPEFNTFPKEYCSEIKLSVPALKSSPKSHQNLPRPFPDHPQIIPLRPTQDRPQTDPDHPRPWAF